MYYENKLKYPSQYLPIVNLFIHLQSYFKRNIVIKIGMYKNVFHGIDFIDAL